ncbi:MAG: hypothetical protein AAF149_03005 [Bacteroidota bacterium]
MPSLIAKASENKSKAAANATQQHSNQSLPKPKFVDNRPETIAQRRLKELAQNSKQTKQLRAVLEMKANEPGSKADLTKEAFNVKTLPEKFKPLLRGKEKEKHPEHIIPSDGKSSVNPTKKSSPSIKTGKREEHKISRGIKTTSKKDKANNGVIGIEPKQEIKGEERSENTAVETAINKGPGPQAPVNAKKMTPSGEKGSSDVAMNFLSSPASVIARGIGSFGAQMAKGFNGDKEQLSAATPTVNARISTQNVSKPKKPAVPQKANATTAKAWKPPAAAIRKDTPKFTPAPDANPQQVESEAAEKGVQVADMANQSNAEIAQMPGEELVQGQEINPSAQVELTASGAAVQTSTTPEIEEYMNIDMDEGFRQQVDASSAGLFARSLAEPKAKVKNAKLKRDQDHKEAVSNATKKADELGKKASEDQAKTIKESRSQIGAEKEKSLAESKATLAEYDGKVSLEKQAKLDEINTQITSHEKQANMALMEADSKVAVKKKEAAKEKEKEEKKAAAKKKKRKWWQKVGDFFSGIAKALAKAVTSIVNKLAKVVKSIIKAAKSLANSIINACTKLVKGLLNQFASLVKGFLNVALAAFPGIRDRLNASIDKVVKKANAAIDKVAQLLKDSVNKLCDTLTEIVNFAQNFYVSAVQGAVMLFEAIVTGNFADLPRIAFMTACNSLGLPGEELWAIVLKARGEAMEIIKRPVRFLRNLIKAGEKGFGQFVSNIKQHLIKGLMGWLFGQIAQTGITIPTKFDGASIFLVIRQVLGVTYEYVRQRAVSMLGEKNVQRVEKVLNYLKRLITEGPEALFAELKEKAEEMKNTIVGKIEEWAITAVIQKAVIKVTSMLIPGGGFVQAIYGMWQTLQFFLENIKKIAAVVNSMLDSLAAISKGAIGSAANLIEKTMVDTLPLVFSWLAKLIGIGGIGQKIKSIIDQLRTPVNKAVDFVIKGAMKMGSSAIKAVKRGLGGVKKKVAGWWKKRRPFTTKSGERHTFYFEGDENNLVPMMASRPTKIVPLVDFLIQRLEIKQQSDEGLNRRENEVLSMAKIARSELALVIVKRVDYPTTKYKHLLDLMAVIAGAAGRQRLSEIDNERVQTPNGELAFNDLQIEVLKLTSRVRESLNEDLEGQGDRGITRTINQKLIQVGKFERYYNGRADQLRTEVNQKLARSGRQSGTRDFAVLSNEYYSQVQETIGRETNQDLLTIQGFLSDTELARDFAIGRANAMRGVTKERDGRHQMDDTYVANSRIDGSRILDGGEHIYKENPRVDQRGGARIIPGKVQNAHLTDVEKRNELQKFENSNNPIRVPQFINHPREIRDGGRVSASTALGGMNAKAYAYITDVAGWENMDFEWLHIRANSLGGASNGTNFVVGTKDTNTQMIPYEVHIKNVAHILSNSSYFKNWQMRVRFNAAGNNAQSNHKVQQIIIEWEVQSPDKKTTYEGSATFLPLYTQTNISKQEIGWIQEKLEEQRYEMREPDAEMVDRVD